MWESEEAGRGERSPRLSSSRSVGPSETTAGPWLHAAQLLVAEMCSDALRRIMKQSKWSYTDRFSGGHTLLRPGIWDTQYFAIQEPAMVLSKVSITQLTVEM